MRPVRMMHVDLTGRPIRQRCPSHGGLARCRRARGQSASCGREPCPEVFEDAFVRLLPALRSLTPTAFLVACLVCTVSYRLLGSALFSALLSLLFLPW